MNKDCIFQQNDIFIKWLIGILGPVIIGSKPAEIISLPHREKNHKIKLQRIKNCIKKCNKLSMKFFIYKNKSTKIFIYNVKALELYITDNKNLRFLEKLGYPKEYKLTIYVEYLLSKMKKGNLPHEIGIFLGYPLKDVIGFMGHPSLKLTKVSGWRIYGNPKLSDEKYKEILTAKDKVKGLLKRFKPEEILYVI
ncbi:MAG: DUF3793 family protein [Firmicutes bacterium]|nr:DUF3793 family protein [Bacillota bacterium]